MVLVRDTATHESEHLCWVTLKYPQPVQSFSLDKKAWMNDGWEKWWQDASPKSFVGRIKIIIINFDYTIILPFLPTDLVTYR